MHRVLVCGGRDFSDAGYLFVVLDHYQREASGFECIIQGCARGADTLAGEYGDARGIYVLPFPADWERDGRAAGPIRNGRMLREGRPTLVIAFPGGRGTADMIHQARAAGVPVLEIPARV
ncbi:DUF2493 domain-containing protein [Bradyrhizobium sp. HKCCYLS2038]|uniref:DUF2493 domain-containing protein n=1 Tax=Bradyrhizobium sp. HKCCYLS2038 TaxID=3420764 RepID=UPI003EBC9905